MKLNRYLIKYNHIDLDTDDYSKEIKADYYMVSEKNNKLICFFSNYPSEIVYTVNVESLLSIELLGDVEGSCE